MRKWDKDGNARTGRVLRHHQIAPWAPPLLDFKTKSFAPCKWFLLDSIPWGSRTVTFRSHEVAIKHSDGPCGCETFSDDSTVSVEVQKAIHMSVQAGPCAFMHWWVWLTEAILIFIGLVAVQVLQGNGARTIWMAVVPVGWLTLRVLVQVSRRRASVAVRALGNPPPSRAHAGKGEFPVPLPHASRVVDAFLHIKVCEIQRDTWYIKPIRGFGLLPTAVARAAVLATTNSRSEGNTLRSKNSPAVG